MTTAMTRATDDTADVLPLDDDTLDRLDMFAAAIKQTPAEAAAALLRDLLFDPDFWAEAVGGQGFRVH